MERICTIRSWKQSFNRKEESKFSNQFVDVIFSSSELKIHAPPHLGLSVSINRPGNNKMPTPNLHSERPFQYTLTLDPRYGYS